MKSLKAVVEYRRGNERAFHSHPNLVEKGKGAAGDDDKNSSLDSTDRREIRVEANRVNHVASEGRNSEIVEPRQTFVEEFSGDVGVGDEEISAEHRDES